jgi:hypothetical protein
MVDARPVIFRLARSSAAFVLRASIATCSTLGAGGGGGGISIGAGLLPMVCPFK